MHAHYRHPTSIRPHDPRRAAGLAIAIAASMLLQACGGGDDDPTIETPPPSVTAMIGADGGTVTGPDDVRVEIPAGALSVPTAITVTKTAAASPALPASAPVATAMYEFTPHGLQFDAPVTISMPSALDPAINPVLTAQPGQAWELVNASAAGGRVSWLTTHFSWSFQYPCGASYPPGTPLPPNGPPGCQFPSSGVTVAATPSSAMTPTVTLYSYRITQAADVVVTFRYSAPLDCVNPAIRTWRYKRPATAPTPMTTTQVALAQTPVAGIPGAFRLTGSTDVPFRFEYGDNGVHQTGYDFACQGGITVGGGVQFTVQAPQPPAAPAAPTITQQPASVSVLVGTTATFDVLATAPDSLVVRWERQDAGAAAFVAVPGAGTLPGGSRLAVAATLADSGARLRAQVCNTLRGVDNCIASNVATLTVTTPPPPPSALASPSRLSGAFLSMCGIASSGGALCWGANTSGELGTGSTHPADVALAAAQGLANVTSIGASSYIGCAVHDGGRLSCWGGYPGVGQSEQSAVPVAIAGVTDARLVRVANGTFCHVDADRRIRCSDTTGPLQIDGQIVEDAIDVAFVNAGRCVLQASGTARCATYDGSAALVTSRVVATARSLGATPGFAGLGAPFCLVLQSGSVRCLGTNANGQLGTGNADTSISDNVVPGIATAVAVAVGTRHACAVLADGTVSCWGSGYFGNGAAVETTRAPRAVAGLSGIVEIVAGYDTTCALRNDGQVLCWGDNAQGSIGSGAIGTPALAPRATAAGAAFAH